jgi:hypothetical protein
MKGVSKSAVLVSQPSLPLRKATAESQIRLLVIEDHNFFSESLETFSCGKAKSEW